MGYQSAREKKAGRLRHPEYPALEGQTEEIALPTEPDQGQGSNAQKGDPALAAAMK
jgi:hypothetical protein